MRVCHSDSASRPFITSYANSMAGLGEIYDLGLKVGAHLPASTWSAAAAGSTNIVHKRSRTPVFFMSAFNCNYGINSVSCFQAARHANIRLVKSGNVVPLTGCGSQHIWMPFSSGCCMLATCMQYNLIFSKIGCCVVAGG